MLSFVDEPIGTNPVHAEWLPPARLRVLEFAEKYPMLSLRTIVSCLIEADREAEFVAAPDRGAAAARLATGRLNAIDARRRG